MRYLALGGHAFLAAALGIGLLALGDGSIAWSGLAICTLLLPATLLFRTQPISLALFCFVALLPVELSKGLAVDSTRTVVFSISPADLVFLALLPIWHLERRNLRRDLGWTSAHTTFLALVAWMAVTGLFSRAPDASLIVIATYAKYFLFFVVAADLCREPAHMRTVLWGGAAGLGFQLAVVAMELVIGSHVEIQGLKPAIVGRQLIFGEAGGLRVTRPSGLLNHPNSLAGYLVLLIPILVGTHLAHGRHLAQRHANALLILALGGALALVATMSRGGWIALVFALLVLAITASRRQLVSRRSVALACAGMVAIGIGAALLHPPILLRLTGGDHGSTIARKLQIDQALKMIRENPAFGVGPGAYVRAAQTTIPPSFSTVSKPFRAELLKGFVHQKYLLVAAETGLVGLLLFVTLLWQWIVTLPRQVGAEDQSRLTLVLGTSAGLVGMAGTFMFEHVAYDVRIGLMAAAAGVLAAAARRRPVPAAQTRLRYA